MLSDIHGNCVALRRVLEETEDEARAIVCLGDTVWGGPQASEVLRELRRLGCPVVMGNTDELVLGRRPERQTGRMRRIGEWSVGALSNEDIKFMRTFKPTVRVDLGQGQRLLCFHGSPRSNVELMGSTTPDVRLGRILRNATEKFLAGGHTHQQMVRSFGDKVVINPGSVGLPYEMMGRSSTNPARAEYATIDYEAGRFSVTMKRVAYDVKELAEAVARSGMPHGEWWMKDWSAWSRP